MSISYGGDNIQDTDGGVLRPSSSVMRNRIINGAMVIDQRNAGASVTPSVTSYVLDRWRAAVSITSKFSVQQNAGSITPPAGFVNYLGVTSLSAYSVSASDVFAIQQFIEGYNLADLNWGTANAKPITLSFWVRSSLTGTFGGALKNGVDNRSYAFVYTISSANTWEQKSITIVGDTTGSWLTTNGVGLKLIFGLGVGSTFSGSAGSWDAANYQSATGAVSVVGTSGATFYITGVQLEVGSSATGFEYRQYQQELALCQRYYYKNFPAAVTQTLCFGGWSSATSGVGVGQFPVQMRTAPTALEQSGTANQYLVTNLGASNNTCTAVPTHGITTTKEFFAINFTTASGGVQGYAAWLRTDGTNGAGAYLAWSAEL